MAISEKLQYAKLDELYLDAKNPRLGRHDSDREISQEDILDLMRGWVLDELAVPTWRAVFGHTRHCWLSKKN